MSHRALLAPIAAVLALLLVPSASAQTTDAPDLLDVGNFRPASDPANTLVDFSFDQSAYLVGGDRSNFHLVPTDADLPENGIGSAPAGDVPGDAVVTVEFSGTLDPADFPRGYVDKGVVSSRQAGANSANPANIDQAAATGGDGTTANPDVASITRDGDQVIWEFDEALTSDDVIQNTGGLRVYFPSTSQSSTIREAGSLAVKPVEGDPTRLRAFYGDDLPEGFELDDAAGGFIPRDTVQGADSDGARDQKNAFDELAPLQDTGAEVCPAPSPLESTLVGSGPTEAPDLLSVDNFRRGPFTSQFEPTTCVDFTFDQAAYLNNGDRSNFSLVPTSGGDALSGTTNVQPPEETETTGDEIITVVFPGDLDPADFARGFVDTGVLSSEDGNASSENPYNVNQSADTDPSTTTENPDLVRVSFAGDSYLFEFDEPLTDDDLVQNTSGLRLYFPETDSTSTIPFAGSFRVEEVDPSTLRAFYRDLPEGYELSDAVGAFVVQGAVQAAPGSKGGNDGANGFHELQISGATLDGELCNGLEATVVGIDGTSGDDVIIGTPADDTIDGRGGDDVICGRGGDDTLGGGPGADELFGESGADTLDGGVGDDLLAGGNGDDLLLQPGASPDGDDVLSGGQDTDTVDYSNRDAPVSATIGGTGGEEGESDRIGDDVENLIGGSAGDELIGNSEDNRLRGGRGGDSIRGRGGADAITGGGGRDSLRGGPGDDLLRARDGRADLEVRCGRGEDSAQLDRDDPSQGCEQVSGPGGDGEVRRARLSINGGQKVRGKRLKVRVSGSCGEACTITAGGTVSIVRDGRRRTLGLGKRSEEVDAGERAVVRLGFDGKARKRTRKIKRALRRGDRVTARVFVGAEDRQGNEADGEAERVRLRLPSGARTRDGGDRGEDRRGAPNFTG